jgi:hypothetical protein
MGAECYGKKIGVVGGGAGLGAPAALDVIDRGGSAVIIDEVLAIGEDERLCDSKTVDNRVRPFRVIGACSKPAEWIYVMKCCGGHALACDPCHEHHLQPAVNRRYCTHCWHPFSDLADGARAVYRV